MNEEIVAFLGPGNLFLSYNTLLFDSLDVSDTQKFIVTKPDDRYAIKPYLSNHYLGADATKYGTNVCEQLYLIEHRGNYESWSLGKWPSGIIAAVIEYIDQGADNGRPFQSTTLTVVRNVA